MKMQPSPFEAACIILAFAVSLVVWLVVFRYKWWGLNLARQQSGRTLAEREGRGLWYARNINSPAKEGLFSAMHFGLVILTMWSVTLLLAPSYLPKLLESTWIALPAFLCIGFVCGSVFGVNIEKNIERRKKCEKNRHVRA